MKKTMRERVVEAAAGHPTWTAKQIAKHLGVERYHVYNNARGADISLPAAPAPNRAPPVNLPAVVPPASPPAPIGGDLVDVTFFATRPEEMAAAQGGMSEWFGRKVAAVRGELADAEANMREAADNGWRLAPFERAVDRLARDMTFYEKVKAAIDAGYFIVPPFPVDVFTIRTDRKKPAAKVSTSRWDRHLQTPRLLPVGEGRYVSDQPVTFQRTIPAADSGKDRDVVEYFGKEFAEVDFPFALARPEIVKATAAAMALKIFDQLGALPNSPNNDPIICGQILKPDRWRTPVTFFVAWWLDTKTL